MKLRLLLIALIASMSVPALAQQTEIDVTALTADTKTFVFDNDKNTVRGYIDAELFAKTTCCGEDRIYLEIQIDPSGHVQQAKALTGKNDCFKMSAVDIVKNVKWDASEFKGPKPVYLEIKPDIECEEGRTNTYQPLPVFNNPLLGSEPAQPTAATPEPAEPETPAEPEPAAAAPAETTSVATAQPPAEPETPAEPEASEPEATEPETAMTEPEPKPEPAQPKPEVAAAAQPEKTDPPTRPASATTPSRGQAPDTPEPQDQEINALRDQLAQLRAQAEESQAEEAAKEAAFAERQRRREEALEARRAKQQQNQEVFVDEPDPAAAGESGAGGLYFEDTGTTAGEEGGFQEGGESASNLTEEDRIRDEIRRLEEQKAQISQQRQENEDAVRRRIEEQQRANQELLDLEAEILRKQEAAAQAAEQRQLDMMQEDLRRIEDERQREEDAYQRMMDEIKRLQQEAQEKIAALEEQKEEMDQLAAKRQAEEQKIMLERTLREQEQARRLEEYRLNLMASGAVPTSTADLELPEGVSSDVLATIDIADFTTDVDSEKLKILIDNIRLLQQEVTRLNERIRLMETSSSPAIANNATAGSTTVPAGSKSRTTGSSNGNSNFVSAAENRSWEDLDIRDPNADPSIYEASVKSQPVTRSQNDPKKGNQPVPAGTEFKPGRGFSPADSHAETHANVAGPKFYARSYIEGEDAMKEKIKTRLKAGGVCGLGQAAFSVTITPEGKVVRHQILASNKPAVRNNLDLVIPTLQFNSVDVRYNQTVYLEFKAEIICEGAKDKVNLREVDSFIKE